MNWLESVLESTLRKLEPFPAVVMDRETTIVTSNPSAIRTLHWLAHDTKLYQSGVRNLSELSLSMDGMRPYLTNWEEVARCILDRMYREIAIEDTDGSMLKTYEQWFSIEGVPKEWRTPPTEASDPLVRFCYQKNGHEINLDSLVTTVGTPADLNYQKIRMRYFIPADEPSHKFLIDLAATGDDLDALIGI